jgi:hypothetical protein
MSGREFWAYRDEENGPLHICDYNQRGFVPDRCHEAFRVREVNVEREAAVQELVEALELACELLHVPEHMQDDDWSKKQQEVNEVVAKWEAVK